MSTAAVTAPANPFISFLDKAGSLFKEGVVKVLPFLKGATEVAEAVEPIIDLALPLEGPLFNLCVTSAIQAEQLGTAAAAAGGPTASGAEKFGNVLATVGPLLTAQLSKNGVTGDAATAQITNYINAIVALLNGPVATATR